MLELVSIATSSLWGLPQVETIEDRKFRGTPAK